MLEIQFVNDKILKLICFFYSIWMFFLVILKYYEFIFNCCSFVQGVVIVYFVILVVLWIIRDLGGVGGWGRIFLLKYVGINLLND